MTVAHTERTGSLGVFENHGEEFRSFGSEGSIRRHGKGDKVGVVSLDHGLNVRVSFLTILCCFQTSQSGGSDGTQGHARGEAEVFPSPPPPEGGLDLVTNRQGAI